MTSTPITNLAAFIRFSPKCLQTFFLPLLCMFFLGSTFISSKFTSVTGCSDSWVIPQGGEEPVLSLHIFL